MSAAELSTAAQDRIADLVVAAEELPAVTSQAELELANQTLGSIARYTDDIDAAHKIEKAPFLSGGRAVDEWRRKALELVIPLQSALKAKVKAFLDSEYKRQRDEDLRQQAEVAKIQREKAAAARVAKEAQEKAEQAERDRVAAEKKLADEKAAAEAKRIADEAKAIEEARIAAEKAEAERKAREERERQIALQVAWDNSAEGKAEAERKRQELERQRIESEAKAKVEAERIAEEKRKSDEAARLEQERIAAEQARLAQERAKAEADEKARQEDAKLTSAVHQTAIEAVTAQEVERVPTRWNYRFIGATETDQKYQMVLLAAGYPDLFEIQPKQREFMALAKQVKGGEHKYEGVQFFEEAVVRTQK